MRERERYIECIYIYIIVAFPLKGYWHVIDLESTSRVFRSFFRRVRWPTMPSRPAKWEKTFGRPGFQEIPRRSKSSLKILKRCHQYTTGWWFNFMFPLTWGNDPTWLIFFKLVETTSSWKKCLIPHLEYYGKNRARNSKIRVHLLTMFFWRLMRG